VKTKQAEIFAIRDRVASAAGDRGKGGILAEALVCPPATVAYGLSILMECPRPPPIRALEDALLMSFQYPDRMAA
jgi:hypothetical protein